MNDLTGQNRTVVSSEEAVNRPEDAVRVMFYNIYGYKWYPDKEHAPHLHSGPIPLRQKMEQGLIQKYAPDVLGMQEYWRTYRHDMTPLLEEIGYRQVMQFHPEPDTNGEAVNYTPLFYRPERLELLDSGYRLYGGPNDVNSKGLTWALFRVRASGKKLVVINTHFMWSSPELSREEANQTRVSNAGEMLDTIRSIDCKTGECLPVIMGGDLNCTPLSDPCNALRAGGMQWAYDIAEIRNSTSGIKGYATYDKTKDEYVTCPVPADEPNRAIDSIWLRQGEEIVHLPHYFAVTDRDACLSSDHFPRFADVVWQDASRSTK